MTEQIPYAIQNEFTIVNKNIKFPTYPDDEFQNSISEDTNLNNYTEENKKKAYNDFFTTFTNCKNSTYEIVEKNLHNMHEYCAGLNEKSMKYIFYFYILEKFATLSKIQFFGEKCTENDKKELFLDDMLYECCNLNEVFSQLYKKEFKEKNDINKITQLFNPMIEKYNKLLKIKTKIGNIYIRMIKYIHKYIFLPLEEELEKFKKIEVFNEDNYFKTNLNEENEINLLNIIIYYNKLLYLDFAFYNTCILDEKDIFNLEESSKEWQNLEKILFRIVPKNVEELKNKMAERKRSPDLFFSIISNTQMSDSTASIFFSGFKNLLYYKTYDNRSKIDSKRYQIINDIEGILKLKDMMKKFKYIFIKILPSIEFRRKIYVKKELPTINRNYIEKLINFMKGEMIPINSERSPEDSERVPEDNNKNKIEIDGSLPIIYRDKVPYKTIKRNYVSVTILHTEKIYFKDETNEGMLSSFFNYFKKDDEQKQKQINNIFKKNTIMIAIHGGGFIGSSTLLHERYLRKWSKYLNIPIFGINYSLAPEYPYPEALNDVYQAYMWIIKNAKNELNMDIKHIIVSGDSAGANLALGLNHLLIAIKGFDVELGKDIILPELILGQYPTTYVNPKNCSDSFLISLNTNMINISSMKYMYNKYVVKYENEDEDPFLNPIKINDYILDRINNRIRLFFGSADVLRGDSIRYLNVISEYNNRPNCKNIINIRGYDFIYLDHGFNGQSEDIQQIGRNVLFPEIEDYLDSIKPQLINQ
jgi:acetyl esterase/lipase